MERFGKILEKIEKYFICDDIDKFMLKCKNVLSPPLIMLKIPEILSCFFIRFANALRGKIKIRSAINRKIFLQKFKRAIGKPQKFFADFYNYSHNSGLSRVSF